MTAVAGMKLYRPELSFCKSMPLGLHFVRACSASVWASPHSVRVYVASTIHASVPVFRLFFKSVIEANRRVYRPGRSAAVMADETRVRILPSHRNSLKTRRANTPEHAGCSA